MSNTITHAQKIVLLSDKFYLGNDTYNNELPWFVPDSVFFINTFIKSHHRVLEIGSGGSTIFFAKRSKYVHSVEMNESYATILTKDLNKKHITNVDLSVVDNKDKFIELLKRVQQKKYDIIIIDSQIHMDRSAIFEYVSNCINDNGIFILDNFGCAKRFPLHYDKDTDFYKNKFGNKYTCSDFFHNKWKGLGTRIIHPMCYVNKIPIFIINHDRLTYLKRCILALEKNINKDITPYEIVIFDHNTTYQPCIHYLNELEQLGYKIYRITENIENIDDAYLSHTHKSISLGKLLPIKNKKVIKSDSKIRFSRNTNLINIINKYLDNNDVQYMCIMDNDIELCDSDGTILNFYIELFNKYKIPIGPHLKYDDIPDSYVKKNGVLQNQNRYWTGNMETYRNVQINLKPIDTTFMLFDKKWFYDYVNTQKFFMADSVRVQPPFFARHLDWYTNIVPSDERLYYNLSAKNTHWSI